MTGRQNNPMLILNADISITVTSITVTFHDFSWKYTVSIGRKNGEQILGKKFFSEYFGKPTNTELKNKKNYKNTNIN